MIWVKQSGNTAQRKTWRKKEITSQMQGIHTDATHSPNLRSGPPRSEPPRNIRVYPLHLWFHCFSCYARGIAWKRRDAANMSSVSAGSSCPARRSSEEPAKSTFGNASGRSAAAAIRYGISVKASVLLPRKHVRMQPRRRSTRRSGDGTARLNGRMTASSSISLGND